METVHSRALLCVVCGGLTCTTGMYLDEAIVPQLGLDQDVSFRRGRMHRAHIQQGQLSDARTARVDHLGFFPYGMGATLQVNMQFVEFFAIPTSEEDCAILDITVGDCRSQQTLEALAGLIALRVWAP